MFYRNDHHSGHFWLYLLSFIGAFLLGKECERMVRQHHAFHGQFKHWHHRFMKDELNRCSKESPFAQETNSPQDEVDFAQASAHPS